MDIEKMQPVFMGVMAVAIGLTAVAGIVHASAPRLEYTCPICGAKFATYDDLYGHFTVEHPSNPIEIIWE